MVFVVCATEESEVGTDLLAETQIKYRPLSTSIQDVQEALNQSHTTSTLFQDVSLGNNYSLYKIEHGV